MNLGYQIDSLELEHIFFLYKAGKGEVHAVWLTQHYIPTLKRSWLAENHPPYLAPNTSWL